jgi:hypothetical protein
MKNKRNHEIVNNQEDEDGYSQFPDTVIKGKSARGLSSNKSTVTTAPGSGKLVKIFPGLKQSISQFTMSPSSNPADPKATGTMGKQKSHY